ncbi:MAG: MFS transporter [Candidatus Devosia symbiotica]|nr:MFS transporter [Candidatus Devosia symbiotica]
MMPRSLAIIAKAYPRAERGKAIGIWAAASSLTTILGPVLGGFVLIVLGDWSWRLIFAINLPLGASPWRCCFCVCRRIELAPVAGSTLLEPVWPVSG